MKAVQPLQRLAAVVLAAGASTRMGENKLLLTYRGKPVFWHGITAVQRAGIEEIVVVLGKDAPLLRRFLPKTIVAVENPEYTTGKSTSIRLGVQTLSAAVDGAFIVLADMPLLPVEIVRTLAKAFRDADQPAIVVPRAFGRQGNPVLFHRDFFPQLTQLHGDQGAKSLFKNLQPFLIAVDVDDDAVLFDLDTPAAFAELLQKK